jgi:hypothetical protein
MHKFVITMLWQYSTHFQEILMSIKGVCVRFLVHTRVHVHVHDHVLDHVRVPVRVRVRLGSRVHLQRGHGHEAWTLSYSMDIDMHHGHGHAPWTWRCTMNMDM